MKHRTEIFPDGHPSSYHPRLPALNFRKQTGASRKRLLKCVGNFVSVGRVWIVVWLSIAVQWGFCITTFVTLPSTQIFPGLQLMRSMPTSVRVTKCPHPLKSLVTWNTDKKRSKPLSNSIRRVNKVTLILALKENITPTLILMLQSGCIYLDLTGYFVTFT